MADLGSGVLVKLLGEMGIGEKTIDDRKSVLLQIRSIIPVLAEGGLWPNQGFFLRVSDSTHAMFVSLPQEEDEMVLCNKLQLGQLINVDKLEAAYPVPMIKGLRPIPGRLPCIGDPIDLVSKESIEKFCGLSDSKQSMEQNNHAKRLRVRTRSSSLSDIKFNERKGKRPENFDGLKEMSDIGLSKNGSSIVDKESDSESTLSTASSAIAARRRSWLALPPSAKKRESLDPMVAKREIKPVAGSRIACLSSVSPASCDNPDDNSSSRRRRKDTDVAPRSVKSYIKSRMPPRSGVESVDPAVVKRSWTEIEILWDSLPSTLVHLGKEVLRQRDIALFAAVEALLEASACERLLKCLSSYSELQSSKGDDQQTSFDKFSNLQDDLARSRLVVQSLTNISPLITADLESNISGSMMDALKLALDRKRKATLWMKAALAFDLNPLPAPTRASTISVEANNAATKLNKPSRGIDTKSTLIVRKQRKNDEVHVGLATEKEKQPDWVKGKAVCTAGDLANCLHEECRAWYLAHVENYLDEVYNESLFKESNNSQVAETMGQIKRVNDWLDVMVKREGGKDSLKDSELEAYGRVRNKIYGILLKHVERNAFAFENTNLMAEG